MTFGSHYFTAAIFLPLALNAWAATLYVDVNNANPRAPYTSWATAAATIQDAVDVAAAGDHVLVTNGVYASGGRVVVGSLTNRLAITNAVTVRSVNGPRVTIIQGYQVPGVTNGVGAIRCVYLTDGASLSGFTLTNGGTSTSGDYYAEQSGGGLWCQSTNALVSTCVLVGNSANALGGGAYQGTFDGCALIGNFASDSGGGVYSGTLNNCTLTGNTAAVSGGGATGFVSVFPKQGPGLSLTLQNCIVYFNNATNGANYGPGTLSFCCTTPNPALGPYGSTTNITADPQLASAWRVSAASPCRGAGSAAYLAGVDINGNLWGNPPSIGCQEYQPGAALGPLSVNLAVSRPTVVLGYPLELTAQIEGPTTASAWDFGDGTVVSNRPYATHVWTAQGTYPVVLRAYNDGQPGGLSATATVQVITAPVHYVATGSTNPTPPYVSWATAATNIQDAVDAATMPGAQILVGDGVYATGGRALSGTSTNRVTAAKVVALRSVNGPSFTAIAGGPAPPTANGPGAIRCVYLGNGASLSGFTLTNGAGDSGGGVWCESSSALVSNCVLTGNSATGPGGGSFQGTLENCSLIHNSAVYGGGAYASVLINSAVTANSAVDGGGANASTLTNCTLTGNLAEFGGGVSGSIMNNCIAYFNQAAIGTNYYSSTLSYCCSTPDPGGVGNFTSDPQLASASHLSAASPCLAAGSAAFTTGSDIDGENWRAPPSMGCDEYWPGATAGPLSVDLTVSRTIVQPGYPIDLTAWIAGPTSASAWDFGDGVVVSNRPYAAYAWNVPGDYTLVLRAFNDSQPGGVSATALVHVVPSAPVHYVAANSAHPVPPYLSWATAATRIQDAVDLADAGGQVLVSDGVYATGGRAVSGLMTNRVTVDRAVTVQSVNGPQFTVVRGWQVPGSTNGLGAIRCVFLADGATLSGFTLTNGATLDGLGSSANQTGGAVWCETTNAVLSNCVLGGNWAFERAGGAWQGTLNNCLLAGNVAFDNGGAMSSSQGGGAFASVLNRCLLTQNSATVEGGGAHSSTLVNCTLTANSSIDGGGANSSALYNCLLTANGALYAGGGVAGGALTGCTLSGNAADEGGGAAYASLVNCIVYYNTGDPNVGADYYWCTLAYCCSPDTSGPGIFGDEPLFVDRTAGDFHLQPNSPCINAGLNSAAHGPADLDGRPRIVGRTVDIGAYEFQGPFDAWLRQYGLPTDGSADFLDTDGDGMNNWQEWVAGTNPTNALSFLGMLPPSASSNGLGVTVSWQSVSGITYFLQRGTNLVTEPVFSTIQSNVVGQATTTSYVDTNAVGEGPFFYRAGVQYDR